MGRKTATMSNNVGKAKLYYGASAFLKIIKQPVCRWFSGRTFDNQTDGMGSIPGRLTRSAAIPRRILGSR